MKLREFLDILFVSDGIEVRFDGKSVISGHVREYLNGDFDDLKYLDFNVIMAYSGIYDESESITRIIIDGLEENKK